MIKQRKKRIVVGMSGGVDSSVTVSLLQKQGYEVIGATMQLLPKEDAKKSACCNLDAVDDAKRVAYKMGIAHYTINSRDTFKTHVIDPFIQTYAAGQTPNPCVECNRFIKFDELWRKADEIGCDMVATGHYSRIIKRKNGIYELREAKDKNKDQSYFLYMLNQEKLKKIKFPLGNFTKDQIRELARDMGLVTANKPDSQEICFVPKSYKHYIEPHLTKSQKQTGPIVNLAGDVLGQHQGLYHYTVGQRKGLNLASPIPLYVLELKAESNTLVVGEKDQLQNNLLELHTFTKVNENEDLIKNTYDVKLRYQMRPIKATVLKTGSGLASLQLQSPVSAIALGQSCVLYQGTRLVGGGIIGKRN